MDSHVVLPWRQKLCYGVGHVLNDLCASMWFSYLLLYFESVNLFQNSVSGYVLLIGQVADAIATPLVGYESDRINGCFGYGKRKSWHALGTLCVVLSFPFIFTQCITCSQSTVYAQFVYYAPFIIIFQFGWASTQISHLSLIPEMTASETLRVELNAIRYGLTVISNLAVYGLTWYFLNTSATGDRIDPTDAPKFRDIGLIVVGVGFFFSVIFHVGTREKSRTIKRPLAECTASTSRSYGSSDSTEPVYREFSIHTQLKWNDWLKQPQFYLMAVLYMFTRLIVNLSQIYLPMFVMHSVKLHKRYVAIVPLVVFASGFCTSFAIKSVNREAGRKPSYMLGLMLVCGGCAWMWFLPDKNPGQTFGAAVFLGAGTTTILVTSLAMTADLIGKNVGSGAFVYGAMSFTDKLSNGLAVMLIQHFHPCNVEAVSCCAACTWYYRDTMVFIPSGIAGLAAVFILILAPITIGQLRSNHSAGNVINDGSKITGPSFLSNNEADERTLLIGSDTADDDEAARSPIRSDIEEHSARSPIGHDLVQNDILSSGPETGSNNLNVTEPENNSNHYPERVTV